jgi:hypothetical protein
LQKAKDRHNLTNGYTWCWSEEIEETWDVLLEIKLDLDVLESGARHLPDILEALTSDLLEIVDLAEETLHVLNAIGEHFILWVDYRKRIMSVCVILNLP